MPPVDGAAVSIYGLVGPDGTRQGEILTPTQSLLGFETPYKWVDPQISVHFTTLSTTARDSLAAPEAVRAMFLLP